MILLSGICEVKEGGIGTPGLLHSYPYRLLVIQVHGSGFTLVSPVFPYTYRAMCKESLGYTPPSLYDIPFSIKPHKESLPVSPGDIVKGYSILGIILTRSTNQQI